MSRRRIEEVIRFIEAIPCDEPAEAFAKLTGPSVRGKSKGGLKG